jgi:hypothetical protein
MEVEGGKVLLLGTLQKRPLSEGSKNSFRNVEAVGSNPITSTKSPVQRPKVRSPKNH